MAFAVKYRTEIADNYGIIWKTDFLFDNFVAGTTHNIIYGLLYNQYAAVDPRNICSTGWHVPTNAEWDILTVYCSYSSIKLKETGFLRWDSPNTGATNEYGFNGVGNGARTDTFGIFTSMNKQSQLHASDVDNIGGSGRSGVVLVYNNTNISSAYSNTEGIGKAIRLIKDSTTLTHGQEGIYTGNDGKVYRSISINGQEWLADNLCETKFANGDLIAEVTDAGAWAALSTGALCAYDNDWDNAYEEVTASITDLRSTGDPLSFEFDADSDDIFDPIKRTKINVNVVAYTDFVLSELYAVEDMSIQVNCYQNDVLYFSGYVTPDQYTESYDCTPYPVSITAICGLTFLKNILYDNSGTYYSGRKRQSEIIYDILSKIGFTTFKEFVNIYEDDMLSGVADSPLDQVFDDVDKYQDMYCLDVLTEILKPYNAVIRQIDGIFCIYRPTELLNTTVYGRYFTSATSKTGITLSPDQYVNRAAQSSDIYQRPGGSLMIQAPARKIYLNHDFGNVDSWITNFQFKGDTFQVVSSIPTLGLWDGWSSSSLFKPMSSITDEQDGAVLSASASTPASSFNLYQSFAGNSVLSLSDIFTLEFEYLWYNYSGSNINNVTFYIRIKADNAAQYLVDLNDTSLQWSASLGYITINEDIVGGNSGWLTFKKQFTGLPVTDSFTITIYQSYSAGSLSFYSAIKNIKFIASSEVISWKTVQVGLKPPKAKWSIWGYGRFGKPTPVYQTRPYSEARQIVSQTYEVDNAINGKEIAYDYMNGDVTDVNLDNIIEQFSGALGVGVRTNFARIDEITLTGASGECRIRVNNVYGLATFVTDLATTAANFVTDYASDYDTSGVTLTSVGDTLYFEGKVAGYDFSLASIATTLSGDLDGTVSMGTPAFTEVMAPTDKWSTRGGFELDPLLEVIGGEIGAHYNRPKHFIQMALYDKLNTAVAVSLLGNIQDIINTYLGNARCFVVNRGNFDVKNRFWELDLIEIGLRGIPGGSSSTTADSTDVTVDSTLITSDATI